MKKVLGFIVLAVIIVVIVLLINKSSKNDENITIKDEQTKENMNNDQSGLIKEVIVAGSGEEARAGDTVKVHYVGTLTNGTKFDSSRDRGEAFEFTLGVGQVIPGWDEGVLGMKVGDKIKLTIPSDLAYGDSGIPGVIPGGATLIFEVELLEINQFSK